MQIRWEEDALADLVELRNCIEQDNPSAARAVAQRIIERVSLLKEQPLMGKAGRIHKTRELVLTGTPYTIIYHATTDVITILRVFHQARKWPA